MNLVADEWVAGPTVERLRADGHAVVWIREAARGDSDDEVLERALADGTPLLTEDKDFGELVYRTAARHAGVVLIRLGSLARASRAERVLQVVRDHGHEFAGRFTVITPNGIRIRRPEPDDPATP